MSSRAICDEPLGPRVLDRVGVGELVARQQLVVAGVSGVRIGDGRRRDRQVDRQGHRQVLDLVDVVGAAGAGGEAEIEVVRQRLRDRQVGDHLGVGAATVGADEHRQAFVRAVDLEQVDLDGARAVDPGGERVGAQQGVAGGTGSGATDADVVGKLSGPSLAAAIDCREVAVGIEAQAEEALGDAGLAIVGIAEAAAVAAGGHGGRTAAGGGDRVRVQQEERQAVRAVAATGIIGELDRDARGRRKGLAVDGDAGLAVGRRRQLQVAAAVDRGVAALHEAGVAGEAGDADRQAGGRPVDHQRLRVGVLRGGTQHLRRRDNGAGAGHVEVPAVARRHVADQVGRGGDVGPGGRRDLVDQRLARGAGTGVAAVQQDVAVRRQRRADGGKGRVRLRHRVGVDDRIAEPDRAVAAMGDDRDAADPALAGKGYGDLFQPVFLRIEQVDLGPGCQAIQEGIVVVDRGVDEHDLVRRRVVGQVGASGPSGAGESQQGCHAGFLIMLRLLERLTNRCFEPTFRRRSHRLA